MNSISRFQPRLWALWLLVATLFVAFVGFAPLSNAAQSSADVAKRGASPMMLRYREGEHYKKVPIPLQAAGDGERVDVTEYFSYGCVHCFNFEPLIEAWASEHKAGVQFHRVPAVFNNSWAFLAQAFYTADVLGVSEPMHQPLFRAIHVEPVNIGDPKLMAELFKEHGGVSAADFAAAFDSFGVRSKVQQAQNQGRTLQLRAVPSMVVAGQYVVDGSMVGGGNQEMLDVVNYLVDMVAAERAAAVASQ